MGGGGVVLFLVLTESHGVEDHIDTRGGDGDRERDRETNRERERERERDRQTDRQTDRG